MDFILASESPRRCELLKNEGYNFAVMPSCADENIGEYPPQVLVEKLAIKKAQSVFNKTNKLTLGGDTIVVLDGVILGKPKDKEQNIEFLTKLNNRDHYVYTGYALIDKNGITSGVDRATVTFNNLSKEDILAYVESGSGLDKAGGYGIQDDFKLVKKIDGSYSTVVGLPIEIINKLLKEKL